MPLVRRRVEAVIARSGVPADSHTGKELLEVLETYPRDELLQVGADELLPVALAVLHLQERRQTRLFLRRDPTGRFWSALVYLPRDRYTTEVRAGHAAAAARAAGRHQRRVHRPVDRVGAGPAALRRPACRSAGAGRREPPDVDVDALQAELAAAARSWTDDLADALAARYGAEAEPDARPGRRRLPGRLPGGLPRRAGRRRPRAAGQPGRRASWRCGCGRRPARPTGERRLTVYRVGERLLLSDVLPVLQNMGVDVVDERPYEIDRIGAPPTWIYDFGVAVPDRSSCPSLRSLPERFTDAVGAVWRGEAEDDGLGALVLLAGLNWRQVTVVRAYVQWLRQAGLPFGAGATSRQTLAAHPDVVARLVALFETRFSPDRIGRPRRSGRPTLVELAASRRSARSSRWTPTACSPRCWPRSPPPSAPRYYAGVHRRRPAGDQARPARASPTCPSRARPARCGSARRG